MQSQGKILEVRIRPTGDEFSRDHAIGETVLDLRDVSDFDEAGGQVDIGGTIYPYLTKDSDNETLILATGLTSAAAEEDEIYLYPYSEEKWAMVDLDDGEDPIDARVSSDLYDQIEVDIRDESAQETCLVDMTNEPVIVDIIGLAPVINGRYLDPETLPLPETSDGLPPPSSPTPEVIGLKGSLFLKWTPVVSNDPVTYEIHMSETDGFTAVLGDSATKVGETPSSMAVIGTGPNSLELVYDDPVTEEPKTYYFRTIAVDVDGAAAQSELGSGSMNKVATADILVNSITAEHLQTIMALSNLFTTRGLDSNGNPVGQGVDIGVTPSQEFPGIYTFGPNGEIEVSMPSVGKKVWRGDAEIDYLTVKTLTTLISTSLSEGATFTMQSSTQAPGNPPAVSNFWTDLQLAEQGAATPFSCQWYPHRNAYITYLRNGSNNEEWIYEHDANGVRTWARNGFLFQGPDSNDEYLFGGGVARTVNGSGVGIDLHAILVRYMGEWALHSHYYSDATNLRYYGNNMGFTRVNTSGTPKLTSDGTSYFIVENDVNNNRFVVREVTASFPNLSIVKTMYFPHPAGATAQVRAALRTTGDFGAVRWVFTINQNVDLGQRQTFVYTEPAHQGTATRMTDEEWPLNPAHTDHRDIMWKDGYFRSLSVDMKVTTFDGPKVVGKQGDGYFTYTWSDGTSETTPSPYGFIEHNSRARIKVQGETSFPAGVDRARLYSKMYSEGAWYTTPQPYDGSWIWQATDTADNPVLFELVLLNTGAGSSPTENTYGAGTPARIRSFEIDGFGNPIIDLFGDGHGRVGPLEWDVDGLDANRLPAPTTTTSNGTSSTATSSETAVRDAVLGNYTFMARAGHRYQARLDQCQVNIAQASPARVVCNINWKAGSTTPSNADPTAAQGVIINTLTGSAGRQVINVSGTFKPNVNGAVTIATFWYLATSAASVTPVSFRELYVVDLGPDV